MFYSNMSLKSTSWVALVIALITWELLVLVFVYGYWAGGRGGAEEHVKLRSYEEIIADAKTNRNILEIQLKKNIINNEKPANLTFDQIGELLFDRLKIRVEDCLRLNLTSYERKWNLQEIKTSLNYLKAINQNLTVDVNWVTNNFWLNNFGDCDLFSNIS